MDFLPRINTVFLRVIEELGYFSRFGATFFRWIGEKPFRWKHLTAQMNSIGVDSTPIILLVSLFTGAVFALQTGYAFRLFNAETLVGSTVGLSLTREIAPVFAALMVTARIGSAMAAELGTMRVTEQIDALEAMAVNPFHFLVVPRVIGATLMLPLLTALFNFVGFIGAYLVGVGLLGIPEGPFIARTEFYVDNDDLFGGLFKAAVFGFLLALISCYQGYKAEGGAAGVGRATTRAVVVSSVTILVVDYFLTQWILEIIEGR
ncbi:MAG: ABC transporter permease [Deltaproteobacteria bacterium]|nr:ABC transporter permease [Deltaproteobacteria bacterium]